MVHYFWVALLWLFDQLGRQNDNWLVITNKSSHSPKNHQLNNVIQLNIDAISILTTITTTCSCARYFTFVRSNEQPSLIPIWISKNEKKKNEEEENRGRKRIGRESLRTDVNPFFIHTWYITQFLHCQLFLLLFVC